MQSRTAILFFSRSPEEESHCKVLHYDESANTRIIKALYDRTKSLLKQQDLPVFEVNEDAQKGQRFSDRLVHAVNSLVLKGIEHLIVIGNDCPFLSLKDLRKARKALHKGKQVIGLSTDGGAYLIGLSLEIFNAQRFQALPWESPHLGQALYHYLQLQRQVLLLNPKSDIDDIFSFRQLWVKKRFHSFFKRLLQLFIPKSFPEFPSNLQKSSPFMLAFNFRGPPVGSSLS